ncbi:LuxR C-terminal-related transcriptional regulator [Streptomyces sp. uw30]|uniref:LuxR C-terminal-related transcriptional regulator n=1 Tax=Streptomyces sp. uw30 TaxID=1828179 RepID=UPI0011CE930C|nr:LuxR family transcriptional regulator [Streptomyces sp. uw30]
MRESEWEKAVRGPLASAAPGTSALVLVEGEAGTGKTRFVQWLLARSQSGQAARLMVTFEASGAPVVDGPCHPNGNVSVRPEAGSGHRPGATQAGAPAASPWSGRLSASSLGELVASGGTGSPVLLVAEDVHRADEQAAHALRTVLADPPAGLRVVMTYRPEELARPGLVLGAPVGYPAELPVIHLRLGPLSAADVQRMAVDALGDDGCSAPFLTRLHERTGGIAQVVTDVLEELRAAAPPPGPRSSGAAGRSRLTARDVDEAEVPLRLAESVAGRLAALDEVPRRLVWAAAVLDGTASEDELAWVAGLSTENGRASLVTALCEGVLHELGPDQYGLRSPMEAAAVYRLVPSPVRSELHGRAAAALEARRPAPWARLARHQLATGRTTDWIESVGNAAQEAVEAGDHQLAISLLEDALAHPEVVESNRPRLALILARSATIGLGSGQTVELLRRLVEDRALPETVRGEIRLHLGLFLGNQAGRGREGRVELLRSVEELESCPVLAARAMSALALPYWSSGPLKDNLAWLTRAGTTAAESEDAEVRAAVAANRATVLLSVGDPLGWRYLEQLPRDSDDSRVVRHTARGLANAADAAVWLGEYVRARELLSEAPRLAARSGAPYTQRNAHCTSLLLDMMTGRWSGLAARARALTRDVDAGSAPDGDAALVHARLALAKGEWTDVGSWLSSTDLSGDDGAVPLVAAASGVRIRLALARQDPAAAAREAGEAWVRLREKAVWVWAAELAPWAVEATVRAGGLGVARGMADEFAVGIGGKRAPTAVAALTWCRALLAEASGELQAAVEYFQRARMCYSVLPRPYEAALVAEAGGRCALAGGLETAAGIQQLSEAAREFEVLGATWDAARVGAELRAHPGTHRRRPPGRPSYDGRLSPREQEVAQLAGAGLSNREIAATLHLSPRTVEQHVARALRKVGALSRHDLARTTRSSGSAG